MTSPGMYQYHTDSFEEMMRRDELLRITEDLLHHSIGFRCWYELEGNCWVIELKGAF